MDKLTLGTRNVSIEFPGVKALTDVNFEVSTGEIRALVGANGAGKSTLMKVFAGANPDYTGEVYLNDKVVELRTPMAAKKLGIQIVYQEVDMALVPTLSVAENVMLNDMVMSAKGKPLMNFGDAVSKGVPWGAVFMVAATSVLGSALTNSDVGITAVVSNALSPIIGGMPPLVFVLFVALATVIITNFASNTVTVTLMYSISLPLVYGGAIAGVNPAALTCVIGACACVACATPPSTAHAAIAAGTGWLKTEPWPPWWDRMVLMFQREVAERIVAKPAKMAILQDELA